MLNEPTLEKLKTMRLEGLAAAWLEQQGQPNTAELSFDERLGLLVDAEWMYRENKKMKRALSVVRRMSSVVRLMRRTGSRGGLPLFPASDRASYGLKLSRLVAVQVISRALATPRNRPLPSELIRNQVWVQAHQGFESPSLRRESLRNSGNVACEFCDLQSFCGLYDGLYER